MLVYFMRSGLRGPVKIGVTSDIAERIADLQAGNPEALRLLGVFDGNEADEHALHVFFSGDRIRGEWFRCSKLLLAVAQGRAVPVAFRQRCDLERQPNGPHVLVQRRWAQPLTENLAKRDSEQELRRVHGIAVRRALNTASEARPLTSAQVLAKIAEATVRSRS